MSRVLAKFLPLIALLVSPAFAHEAMTCADADTSCSGSSLGFMTDEQILGRVCVAMKRAGVGGDETGLYSYVGTGDAHTHARFVARLRDSLNACTRKMLITNQVAGYFDAPSLSAMSVLPGTEVYRVVDTVRADLVMVYTSNDDEYASRVSPDAASEGLGKKHGRFNEGHQGGGHTGILDEGY